MIEIRRYVTADSTDVLHEWLEYLNDRRARAKIAARINRLANGNFGDNKALGRGLYELQIDWGPGYRVYYALQGQLCILLLCGGDKRKQASDMRRHERIGTTIRTGRIDELPPPSISHDEAVVKELKDDPLFAAEYLRAALEEEDEPHVLLIALRHIAEAQGGLAKVAKAAGVERESLYRALSAKGNPRFTTLIAVIKAVGLKLTVEPAS